jgi:hypothetical protein
MTGRYEKNIWKLIEVKFKTKKPVKNEPRSSPVKFYPY